MFKNYLKVVLRNIAKHKGYTFINIAGLAIGLGCCILILLYIQVELSYDRFHQNADQIYRVVSEFGEKGSARLGANTSYPIAPNLKADFPEVLEAVRIRRAFKPIISYEDKIFREDRFFFADSTFLDFFAFPILKGDRKTVLRQPNSLVITEETARRFFGDEEAIGKTFTYDNLFEFRVDAVIHNLPENTHIEFDFLAPIQNLGARSLGRWTTFTQNYTYIRVPKNYAPEDLEAKLPGFTDKHVGDSILQGSIFNLGLQPLTDIHLHSHLKNEIKPNGDIAYVQLLSAIAFFILIIACINFMNLATARSVNRAKEVCIRKVAGAQRGQLIKQFLGETILISLISFLLSLFLIELLLPTFNNLINRELDIRFLIDPLVLLGLVIIVLITGMIAGSYPALFLSKFQPTEALKTKGSTRSPAVRMRQGLVVFQFAISIVLIVCASVVYDQMDYMMEKDLGFDKQQVLVVPIDQKTGRQSEVIKREFKKNLNVLNATASMLIPTKRLWTWGIKRETAEKGITIGTYMIDFDFLETYGMEIIAGRNFSKTILTDSTESFLLNEAAVLQLGWATPQQALGQQLNWGNGRRTGSVVGIVKDFHVVSLQERIEPIVFFINPDYYYLSIKIRADEIQNTLSYIGKSLAKITPYLPFEYFFIDENFDRLHRANERLAQTFGAFSFIAISIACLGLFGLVAFTAEQRTKEIGVRKVLGASIPGIVVLLSKDFAKLIVWALVISAPIAYFAMSDWLQRFAYRIEISWWVFALAGGLALGIALLTVSTQAIRAALANPVESLRYE